MLGTKKRGTIFDLNSIEFDNHLKVVCGGRSIYQRFRCIWTEEDIDIFVLCIWNKKVI